MGHPETRLASQCGKLKLNNKSLRINWVRLRSENYFSTLFIRVLFLNGDNKNSIIFFTAK